MPALVPPHHFDVDALRFQFLEQKVKRGRPQPLTSRVPADEEVSEVQRIPRMVHQRVP